MRYSRQELVMGKESQTKLQNSKIVIVGLGALGTVAAELLTRAGIGTINLIDRDLVELTNLQRQMIYTEEDIEKPKAEAAYDRLKKINSEIKLNYYINDLNFKNVEVLLKNNDLILDCTDNLYTRFLINEFCRKNSIPWIYSAAIKEHGNVMAVTKDTPCFRCTFQDAKGLDTCDTAGILNSISVSIAALQVNEAITLLTGDFKEQKLIHLDLKNLELSKIRTNYNESCHTCKKNYEYLDGKKETRSVSYQCSNIYQFYVDNPDLEKLKLKFDKIGKVRSDSDYLFFDNLSVFKNGRILVKSKNMENAKATISKYIGL